MFIQLMKNLDKKLKNAQEAKLESHIDEQKTQARLQQNRALDESLGAEEKYANLEKLLQKYEAEIREHVRVEQQMKIYVENLQESFDEKEKAFKDELEAKKKSIEELENKIIKAEQRATELSAETKVLKELLKNFTINTTNTYNSSRIFDKQRASLENLHSKDKNSIITRLEPRKENIESLRSSKKVKSRDKEQSPPGASKSGHSRKRKSYLANMEVSIRAKKCIPKNLFLNFKKLTVKPKAEGHSREPNKNDSIDPRDSSLRNCVNFIRMNTISTQGVADFSYRRASQSYRTKEASKDPFQLRKKSTSNPKKEKP